MFTITEYHHQSTYITALGMLRRGKCSTELIAAYLRHVLNRDSEGVR